jgi:hypothetical protein
MEPYMIMATGSGIHGSPLGVGLMLNLLIDHRLCRLGRLSLRTEGMCVLPPPVGRSFSFRLLFLLHVSTVQYH